ncbi:MAG: PIN domain-containing protein [Candidatus Margulisbacteria bacterium]|jgi:predicted nucleic acid-binding protein|nr:PIN domain-containing protein [Candidatus Margulisiibacteriota bacterium]
MNAKKVFIDTNVLVYAYSAKDIVKKEKAIAVLNAYDCLVSTQVLNEFCNVCLKKLGFAAEIIQNIIEEVLNVCSCHIVDYETIKHALLLQANCGFSYYDCLIVASASECECQYLFTEDLTDQQVIDNVTIKNAFC